MQVLNGQYPPNFEAIAAVLPDARKPCVIFAYGDVIYNPAGNKIPPCLLAHEAVHGRRQLEMGIETWWQRYLDDVNFRYTEELLAHRAEFQSASLGVKIKEKRGKILAPIARRLAGPLYGKARTYDQAKRDILSA